MNYDTQLLIETMYSKHQARDLIRKELKESPDIMALVNKAVEAAKEWQMGDYFESKNRRLAVLDSDIFEDFYIDVAGSLAQFGVAKYTQIVGMVSGMIKNMSQKEAIRTAGELIGLAAIVDLVELLIVAMIITSQVNGFWIIPPATKSLLQGKGELKGELHHRRRR